MRAKEYTNVFSLHALYGVSRSERGLAAAGFGNHILEDARGLQYAGFMNLIGGQVTGATFAGFINIYNGGTGLQDAGFLNLSRGNVTGVQAAGFFNKSHDITGFQMAGFMNMAKATRGVQAAGFINKANNVNGGQLAGFINIADSVKDFQAAGFINIARKVRGVQLAGFINIADSSDYPIGIINIIKNGEQRIGITVDDNATTVLAFRSGGRKLYGIIGLGYNFSNTDEVYAVQAGIGAHFFSSEKFRLNTEITTLGLEDFDDGSFTKHSLSILPSLKLGSKLEISGGPSLNYVNTDSEEGRDLLDYDIWSRNKNGHLHTMYIGYSVGVHFIL
jgi:hypothetical protein